MYPHRLSCLRVLLAASAAVLLPTVALAEDAFELPPISYSASTPKNRVAELAEKLSSGEQKLKHGEGLGYLPALLEALQVSTKSQTLVFSKTSMQRRRISPRTPRAVYFGDDVYVGFCRDGEVIEISTADPQLGAVFYTLDQKPADQPKLTRQTDSCLTCHASSRTQNIPGHLMRSLFVDRSGEPNLSAGGFNVDHRTPFEHRWGGWYVTGTHGEQSHLGNLTVEGRDVPRPVDNPDGQNITDLSNKVSLTSYLSPHSDIVALMVLEHQTLVHNRLTQANFETRSALHYQREMNRALGEPEDRPLESVSRRIQNAGDKLVDALLLVDEAPISSPILGISGFAEEFANAGPRDSQGRSLRALDLQRRLFKYPCSYLIYSPSFDSLPDEVRSYIWQRLHKVLTGAETSLQFAHLSAADRQAISEILRETKPGLPEIWK